LHTLSDPQAHQRARIKAGENLRTNIVIQAHS
jgi:hypothetical protein